MLTLFLDFVEIGTILELMLSNVYPKSRFDIFLSTAIVIFPKRALNSWPDNSTHLKQVSKSNYKET